MGGRVDELEAEVMRLQTEIERRDAQTRELRLKCQLAEDDARDARAALARDRGEAARREEEIEELRARSKATSKYRTDADYWKGVAERYQRTLEIDVVDTTKALEEAMDENARLRAARQRLTNEVVQLSERLTWTSTDLADSESENGRLYQMVACLQNKVEAMNLFVEEEKNTPSTAVTPKKITAPPPTSNRRRVPATTPSPGPTGGGGKRSRTLSTGVTASAPAAASSVVVVDESVHAELNSVRRLVMSQAQEIQWNSKLIERQEKQILHLKRQLAQQTGGVRDRILRSPLSIDDTTTDSDLNIEEYTED